MRLAGDDDLDRQRQQPLDVGEDEPGPLVGREPAREADRQPVAVDPRPLGEARLRGGVDAPDGVGRRLAGGLPVRLVGRRLRLHAREPEQLGEGGVEPAAEMDAVRDVADRRLLPRPERRPHLARNLAMEVGDAVRRGGQPQREGRQPEAGLVAEAPQRKQALGIEAALGGEIADVADDELLVEDLVARRHGCVRREDGRAPDRLERVVGLRAGRDERAQPLYLEEGGVPLVQVEDVRLDPERRQRANAADAEQQLLADPMLAIAAVESVGEPVDLEQVERDDAGRRRHVLAPDPGLDRLAGEVDRDGDVLADEPDGLRVDRLVVLGLAAGLVDPLAEVAAGIEEADSDQRHAELGRGLEVIAGEDPEAAGVDRQPLVDAELHAEVRDEQVVVLTPGALPPADGVGGHV